MKLCECGCGNKTTIATQTRKGTMKGQPHRFLPHHNLRRESKIEIIQCFNCNKETTNPKFCSKTCSAIYTNKESPKRKKTKQCKLCSNLILSNYIYCSDCFKSKNTIKIKTTTANWGTMPYIRQHARKIYKKSGQPQHCIMCNYSLHFDVCHIKDIKQYEDGTPLTVINDISNLLALCKNHHWEFDHEIW